MPDSFGMNSRVHPNYKTQCRVTNWPFYDRALVQRGDITMWISETALTLRTVFNLPLRQTEGFWT